jgi:hypothetical protein
LGTKNARAILGKIFTGEITPFTKLRFAPYSW